MGTNKVFLVGRMTSEADMKFLNTQNGEKMAVANFTLAVNRNFKNQAGEYEADFIRCQVRGRQADNLANWTKKGSKIAVVGSIRTRNYENQQGQRVYITEVDVSEVEYLDPREQQAQNGHQQGDQPQQQGYQQQGYQPQQQGYQQQQPNFSREPNHQQGSFFKGSTTNPIEISDDDLPF